MKLSSNTPPFLRKPRSLSRFSSASRSENMCCAWVTVQLLCAETWWTADTHNKHLKGLLQKGDQQLGDVLQAQLVLDVGSVVFDCSITDTKLFCDFLVGGADRRELKHI